MTRQEFLNDLRSALSGMKEEERESVISYYSEMIDDRMEAGMTEEAAVKAMEPVREIASRVLEEAGVAETKEQSKTKGNWQEIHRPAESVSTLHIQAESKRLKVIGDEETREITLRYCIGSGDIFRLHEDGGVLTLEHKLRPVSSFVNEKTEEGFTLEGILSGVGKLLSSLGDRIVGAGSVFSYESPENEIEVIVPKAFAAEVQMHTSNARISLEDITCTQPVTLTTSNARIVASDLTCSQQVVFTTSNSRIVLEDVNAAAARLTTSNGRVEMEDVYVRGALEAASSNGALCVEDTTAEGRLRLITSNSAITLSGVASPDITLKTSNGSIGGTIKGKRETYAIRSATSNAANQLGANEGGENTLSAFTSNGAITLKFEEE